MIDLTQLENPWNEMITSNRLGNSSVGVIRVWYGQQEILVKFSRMKKKVIVVAISER